MLKSARHLAHSSCFCFNRVKITGRASGAFFLSTSITSSPWSPYKRSMHRRLSAGTGKAKGRVRAFTLQHIYYDEIIRNTLYLTNDLQYKMNFLFYKCEHSYCLRVLQRAWPLHLPIPTTCQVQTWNHNKITNYRFDTS